MGVTAIVGVLVALGAVSPFEPATRAPRPQVAVTIDHGEDGEFDACSGARVKGIRTYLSVRTAPSATAKELDRLPNGYVVCAADGRNGFMGIVYRRDGGDLDHCFPVERPPKPYPYRGRCHSGWVSNTYMEVFAG